MPPVAAHFVIPRPSSHVRQCCGQVAKAGLRARRPLDMSLDGRKADKLFELFGFPPAKLEFGLAQLKGLEVQGWPDRIRSMIAQRRQVSA